MLRRIIRSLIVMTVVWFVLPGASSLASSNNTGNQVGPETQDKTVEDTIDDVNYDDIQKVIDDIMPPDRNIDFKQYVVNLATGQEGFSLSKIVSDVQGVVADELKSNRNIIIQLLVVAVIAAVFTNFSNIFQNNQISETSFYVTYLLLFSILTSSFYIATNIATTLLGNLLDFMKVLIPTYMLSIAFSSGASTSMVYYESTLIMITLVDFVLMKVVIPLINIYFILMLANNMSKEDMLSKLTELLETVIQWTMRSMLALVIGFNTIQGLIVPMAAHVKNSVIIKTTSAIPGIGNAINSVTETILGAGVLVKNAIGVGGLLVIISICTIPLIKLIFFVLVYKFGVAIVQPISDKRILGCMSASANAANLLLSTVFIAILLFMISIAIMAATTNLRI